MPVLPQAKELASAGVLREGTQLVEDLQAIETAEVRVALRAAPAL